jgi:hypothetical protein
MNEKRMQDLSLLASLMCWPLQGPPEYQFAFHPGNTTTNNTIPTHNIVLKYCFKIVLRVEVAVPGHDYRRGFLKEHRAVCQSVV